jgi:phage terminase large subunit-like protein
VLAALMRPVYAGGEIPHIPDREEVIELAAADPSFFNHYFFGRTFRQEDPPFAPEVWAILDNPEFRYVNLEIFRGGSKTSMLRVLMAKRICYGLSKTILYVGKSDDHAVRSVSWLRKQVLHNARLQEVFGLGKGLKFNDSVLEIENEALGDSVYVSPSGITGSIRGINFDDYRPDLIICDDVISKETVGTPAAREKVYELLMTDVKESLEAASDNPAAMMAYINTPLDDEDPGQRFKKDPEFRSFSFSCWTKETADLPIDQQQSSWPGRFSSDVLRGEKRAAIVMNRLWMFTREKECRLSSPDTSAFKSQWLQTWTTLPPLNEIRSRILWIDPVPPPSEIQIAKGLAKKDYEAFAVVGEHNGNFYILEIKSNRGHEPDWTMATFFEMMERWKMRTAWYEAIGYQRALGSFLRMQMKERRTYYSLHDDADKRSKYDKILDGLHPVVSNKLLYVHPSMTTFIEQFSKYPDVGHDDELEAVARAVEKLHRGLIVEGSAEDDDDLIEHDSNIDGWRAAP